MGALVIVPWHGAIGDAGLRDGCSRVRRFVVEEPEAARRELEEHLGLDCAGRDLVAMPPAGDTVFAERVLGWLAEGDVAILSGSRAPGFMDAVGWLAGEVRAKGLEVDSIIGAGASAEERRHFVDVHLAGAGRAPQVLPDVALLGDVAGLPSRFTGHRFADRRDASVYLLDYNYVDRAASNACIDRLEAALREGDLLTDGKTLLLAACGLDPHGARLITFAREFAHNYVFFEGWNRVGELAALSGGRPGDLYVVPVSARLDLGAEVAMPPAPNRRVFVSLGGDDDLDLVRAVVRRRPDLRFLIPDLAWDKTGTGRREFGVRVDAPNVEPVACRTTHFSLAYQRAYVSADTVLVVTRSDRRDKMRGGLRVADAIRSRKRLVMTPNPMCEALMAQHERTCLVATHDADAVSEALDRTLKGGFEVDGPLFEAIRALTSDDGKVAWMTGVARDPAAARTSPFWRDSGTLSEPATGALDALFGIRRGQELRVEGGRAFRVRDLRQPEAAAYEVSLASGEGTARPLVARIMTVPTARFFCRTARGHYLSYQGSNLTPDELAVLGELARYV